MHPTGRSVIWNTFTKNGNDLATCTICMRSLSIKRGSTTNLFRHVKLKHPDIYVLLIRSKKFLSDESPSKPARDEIDVITTTTEIEAAQNEVDPLTQGEGFVKDEHVWTEDLEEVDVDELIPQHSPPPPAKKQKIDSFQEESAERTMDDRKVEEKRKRCRLYADYVASKLETYSDHVLNMVQHNFSEIMFKADMGEYNAEK